MQDLPKSQGELKCRGTEAGDVNVGTKHHGPVLRLLMEKKVTETN